MRMPCENDDNRWEVCVERRECGSRWDQRSPTTRPNPLGGRAQQEQVRGRGLALELEDDQYSIDF